MLWCHICVLRASPESLCLVEWPLHVAACVFCVRSWVTPSSCFVVVYHLHVMCTAQEEALFLGKQGVSVIVDLSSALNLFPIARLCNNRSDVMRGQPLSFSPPRLHRRPRLPNPSTHPALSDSPCCAPSVSPCFYPLAFLSPPPLSPRHHAQTLSAHSPRCSLPEYQASLELVTGVLAKMPALGSSHLILSLHRYPENNYDAGQALTDFGHTLTYLASIATNSNVTLHLKWVPLRRGGRE
jgi:hypothetical protein